MSSPGLKKHRKQTGPAKAQVQKLLRTMCNFMLPVIERAGGQKRKKGKRFDFGVQAQEFVAELEKFILGITSHSQLHNKDITIETTSALKKDPIDYLEGFEETSWLWDLEILTPEDDEISDKDDEISDEDDGISDEDQDNSRNLDDDSDSVCQSFGEAHLQQLRHYITQNMPIRLLSFEPDNSTMKISLLEKADIYNYLAPKWRLESKDTWVDEWDAGQYAILSHTWTETPGELTYGDWHSGSVLNDRNPKCQKLINFCKAAWEDHGITLGWIDTVCINKESSAELDESIRSMFSWYENAAVSITYLAGTDRLSDMRQDRWFTRGWTLQELVAPRRLKFYNKDWKQLSEWNLKQNNSYSDKDNDLIFDEIQHATTITKYELCYWEVISISRKMQLAAKRQVTRQEDKAYCLMGLFNVSISTAYGEGADRAFFRLVEEIFRSTKDVSDIFNWAGNHSFDTITSLFPLSPSSYLNRLTGESGPGSWRPWRPIEPLTLTHLGLRTPILLMPAVPTRESILIHRPIGAYHATVSISPVYHYYLQNYHLLRSAVAKSDSVLEIGGIEFTMTFGTLNVEEQGTRTRIPKTCVAVFLAQTWNKIIETSSEGYQKVPTKKPITFDLQKTGGNFGDDGNERYYEIERSELGKHGMKLVTLYL